MKIKTVGIVNGCSGHWHQAAQDAGLKVLWDYEPSWQREVIEHNFDGKIFSDTPQFLNNETAFGVDKPDLICGSPPCTGFTPAAGKAYRPELEINNYVVEFSKIVAAIKPKCFLMEEVKNFFLIENKFFKTYIKNIQKDYNYTHDIVNAFDYGSPQNRHRFVIAGILKPENILHTKLFYSDHIYEEYPLHM